MIAFVENLQAKGHAYEIDDGVYLDVKQLPNYGQYLSRQSLAEMQAGARVHINEQKHHPADFALWRKASPEHIMQWDSPWGRGYPGWHIECSVMSMKYLGDTFDIHTGGEDHIAIHHENEIAQSEAATGKPFVNYWMHGRFLRRVDEAKMSKSTGKFLVVDDFIEQGIDPLAYRYYCFTASYRAPLTFSWEGLHQAANSMSRFQQNMQRLAEETQGTEKTIEVNNLKKKFSQTIANDFDMPGAVALIWDTIRLANRTDDMVEKHALLNLLLDFDRVLGLSLEKAIGGSGETAPAEIVELLEKRELARTAKDWSKADSLRESIYEKGFQIEDTASGPQLRQIR
jgi:cysteinyl-tRNA synthetase